MCSELGATNKDTASGSNKLTELAKHLVEALGVMSALLLGSCPSSGQSPAHLITERPSAWVEAGVSTPGNQVQKDFPGSPSRR